MISRNVLRAAPTRLPRIRNLLPAVLITGLAACDFPSAPPKIEQTWVVPIDSTTLRVSELLPPELGVSGSAFVFTPSAVAVNRTLGSMCSACSTSATAAPKPAFTSSFTVTVGTGADIISATTGAGNTFQVRLSHNFNFDPLRPSASARGFVVMEIRSAGALLGRDSVSGNTQAFPSSQQLNRSIPISSGAIISSANPLVITVTVNSPAGDPVVMNTSQTMTAATIPAGLTVTNVTVRVASRAVSAVSATLDLDIDDEIAGRVQSGAMLFTLGNPFGISGNLNLTITAPGQSPIAKTLALSSAASSTATVEFTGAELRSIMGKSGVTLGVSGVVNGPAGGVSISPTQALTFANRLRISIVVGG